MLMWLCLISHAQYYEVKGRVLEGREPIIGATVRIEGTDIGTLTNIDGKFVLKVPTGQNTIKVSYVGYKVATCIVEGKSELTVKLGKRQSNAKVKLLEATKKTQYGGFSEKEAEELAGMNFEWITPVKRSEQSQNGGFSQKDAEELDVMNFNWNAKVVRAAPVKQNEQSQPDKVTASKTDAPMRGGRRIALIIGNNDYGTQRLKNPVNDAQALMRKLRTLGFETFPCINKDKEGMKDEIVRFCEKASKYDMALFYYAGHAIQSDGINYLIPAQPAQVRNKTEMKREYIDLPYIIDCMYEANAKRNIVILDACRDTPDFVATRSANRGLANFNEPEGFLVAFATQAGDTAADGKGSANSPYMTALLEQLNVPRQDIDQLFIHVREQVQELTNGEQRPFYKNNLSEQPKNKFYFNVGR